MRMNNQIKIEGSDYMDNNFKILLSAALDAQKSKNQVNAQIQQLKTEAIKVGVTLDTKVAQASVKALSAE